MENSTIAIPQERDILRSELNIEKWPIFTTSTFKGKSREFSRDVTTLDGKMVSRKVVIGKIADKEVGVLRTFDMKGFYALIKLWEEAGKPTDKNVHFALHKIAEILKREWGRTTHRQIRNMIDRLRFIPIKWICSWRQRDSDKEFSLENGFTILEDKQIFEKKETGQMEFSFSSFRFHKEIIKNLLENYTKPIYLDIIINFKKEISILLYRHVDLIMADKNHYERNTENLFIDLGLGEYSYPSKRKQLLEPVLQELEGVELSTGILSEIKLEKTQDEKDWKVIFRKSKKRIHIEYKPDEGKPTKEAETLINFFNKRFPGRSGTLKPDTVNKLIQKYTFDKVMLHISRISNKYLVINPVGLLRASLTRNWDLPPTQEDVLQEKNQKKDKLEQKKKELEQQDRARYLEQKQQEERLNKIFQSLPEEEQNQLKEEAKQTIIQEHPNEPQPILNSFYLRETMLMIKIREILKQRIVKTEDLIGTIL